MGRLRLEPMSDADIAVFPMSQLEEYTKQIEVYGGWTAEDARAKAERDMALTFPGGQLLPGHHLFHLLEEATGEWAGILWYRRDERGLWLFQVTIEESRRGQGLGREAMELLEAEARRLGAPRIELNVFGGNDAARALYRAMGYREDAVTMSKPTPAAGRDAAGD
jgi:RimJ/RimL family protein N-acetyltransferase